MALNPRTRSDGVRQHRKHPEQLGQRAQSLRVRFSTLDRPEGKARSGLRDDCPKAVDSDLHLWYS